MSERVDPNRRGALSYARPPVVEVSCGVTFEPLQMPRVKFGAFWELLRKEYPIVEELEPLPTILETFDPRALPAFEFHDQWRDLLVSKDDDRVVQVQRDRLLCNWRKGKHEKEYPRFDAVLKEFRSRLALFEDFARTETGSAPKHLQYEVTYYNHIHHGDSAWRSPAEMQQLLPDFAWRAGPRFLPAPERMDHRLSFQMPGEAGRLHVRAHHARRRSDYEPVLVLELTARGFATEPWTWFQTAHDWIVYGFEDLTSTEVQESTWLKT